MAQCATRGAANNSRLNSQHTHTDTHLTHVICLHSFLRQRAPCLCYWPCPCLCYWPCPCLCYVWPGIGTGPPIWHEPLARCAHDLLLVLAPACLQVRAALQKEEQLVARLRTEMLQASESSARLVGAGLCACSAQVSEGSAHWMSAGLGAGLRACCVWVQRKLGALDEHRPGWVLAWVGAGICGGRSG